MATTIKGNIIIEDNHLDNAIKSAEMLEAAYKKLDAQVVKTANDLKTVTAKGDKNSAKGIKALNQALTESEKKKKAVIKIDKERAALEVKLKALNSDKIQQNEQLKILAQQQAKANKQQARETLGLVGAYEKESQLLIKLRKRLKDLIITEGEGSSKTKQLAAQVTRLDTKLKKADATAGQFQRQVGKYPKAMGGAIGSLKKLAGALGLIGGVQLAIKGIRNMFNVVKNFDQATANLSSVLGVNIDEMAALTEQSKELGRTTQFTASAVSELQLEFAKLGFSQKDIGNMTEATLQLASAAGTELGNAATIVGSTMRAFGIDTSETQRVVDVMAKSFSSSSLDIEKFSSAMANVAPAAKAIGLTIEETTALIGTLTDSGIDASSAGTGLRNMFLQAKKQGIDFDDALEKIAGSSDKLKTSFDLFGAKGSTLGVILAENGVTTDALTKKLKNAGGAAEEMADKQLNTLGGAVELLKSAWEGFILKMNDSSGASSALTNTIKFLAENLEAILNTLILVGKALVLYKVATKGAAVASTLLNKRLLVKIKNFKILGVQVFKSAKGLGLYAAALFLIVTAALDVINRINDVKTAQDVLNDSIDVANEKLDEEKIKLELVGKELFNTKIASEERQKVLDKINAEYGTTLKNLEDEAAFANQVAQAYKAVVSEMNRKIKIEVFKDKIKETLREIIDLEEELEDFGIKDFTTLGVDVIIGDATPQKIANAKEAVDLLYEKLALLQGDVVNGKVGTGPLANRFGTVGAAAKDATKDVKKLLNFIKDSPLDGILDEDKKADFESFKRNLKQSTREVEVELRKRGVSEKDIRDVLKQRRLQDLKDERDAALEIFGSSSQEFLDLDLAVRREVDKRNKEQADWNEKQRELERLADEKEKKRKLDEAKDLANKTLEITTALADNKIAQIDREIEARKNEVEESKTEIQRLQALAATGNIDAAKSLKAEKVKQAKDKIEIENLEKKKRNLLLQVAALNQANLLLQNSDVNGLENAAAKVQSFMNNLPTFYDGTGGTVADALGATGTRDGHMVRVHDNEHIIGANDSSSLHAAGLKNNADIVGSALAYQNNNMNSKALAAKKMAAFTDGNIVSKLDNVEKAIKNIKFIQQHIDLSTGMETIIDGNKKTTNNHRPSKFKI